MTCLYRVDCGRIEATPYVDRLGHAWLPDQELAPGRAWGAIGGHPVHRDDALPPSDPDRPGLYRSERYAMRAYEFHLPDATYEVRLHFAETFESHDRAGLRRFDVGISGLRVLHEFDPYAAAGGFAKPVVRRFAGVGAPDGRLSIEFHAGAQINAIGVSDSVHMGLWGAYLAACVFFATIAERSPVDVVPASVLGGQVDVDPATARFLQQVAWDPVQAQR